MAIFSDINHVPQCMNYCQQLVHELYWSTPSNAQQNRKRQRFSVDNNIINYKENIEPYTQNMIDGKTGRVPSLQKPPQPKKQKQDLALHKNFSLNKESSIPKGSYGPIDFFLEPTPKGSAHCVKSSNIEQPGLLGAQESINQAIIHFSVVIAANRLIKIIKLIGSLDIQEMFWHPVDQIIAPRYYDIIKEPMWFQRMIERVETFQYHLWVDLEYDFNTICNNAKKYNPSNSIYHKLAKQIEKNGCDILDARSEDGKEALRSIWKGKYLTGCTDVYQVQKKLRELIPLCRKQLNQNEIGQTADIDTRRQLSLSIYKLCNIISDYKRIIQGSESSILDRAKKRKVNESRQGVFVSHMQKQKVKYESKDGPQKQFQMDAVFINELEYRQLAHKSIQYHLKSCRQAGDNSEIDLSLSIDDECMENLQDYSIQKPQYSKASEDLPLHRYVSQLQNNTGLYGRLFYGLKQCTQLFKATTAKPELLIHQRAEAQRQYISESYKHQPPKKVLDGRSQRRRKQDDGPIPRSRSLQDKMSGHHVIKVPTTVKLQKRKRDLLAEGIYRLREQLLQGKSASRFIIKDIIKQLDVSSSDDGGDLDDKYLCLHKAMEDDERATYLQSIGKGSDKRKNPDNRRGRHRQQQDTANHMNRMYSMPQGPTQPIDYQALHATLSSLSQQSLADPSVAQSLPFPSLELWAQQWPPFPQVSSTQPFPTTDIPSTSGILPFPFSQPNKPPTVPANGDIIPPQDLADLSAQMIRAGQALGITTLPPPPPYLLPPLSQALSSANLTPQDSSLHSNSITLNDAGEQRFLPQIGSENPQLGTLNNIEGNTERLASDNQPNPLMQFGLPPITLPLDQIQLPTDPTEQTKLLNFISQHSQDLQQQAQLQTDGLTHSAIPVTGATPQFGSNARIGSNGQQGSSVKQQDNCSQKAQENG